jgi:hypothetical protein
MPESLHHFPKLAAAMGFQSTRAVKHLCRRYQIPVVRLNRRMNALTDSHYRLLLDRMTTLSEAA